MPSDRFIEVWNTKHIQCLCATKTNIVVERLFVPKCQYFKYQEMIDCNNNVKELNLFADTTIV